jgi:hypothetical protein
MPRRPFAHLLAGGLGALVLLVGLGSSGAVEIATPAPGGGPRPVPTEAMTSAGPSAPAVVSAGATTESATSYALGTASFTAGRLYVAFLTLGDTAGAVDATPGVAGTGTTWTRVDAGEATADSTGMTAYYFRPTEDSAGVALSTDALSAEHEGLTYSIVEVGAAVDPATPIAQYSAGKVGPATGYTRTLLSAPQPDSLVLGSFSHNADEASTPNEGWTEVAGSDLGHSAPARAAHVIYDDSSPDATAGSTWASPSSRRGIVLEVPGAGATGSAPSHVTLAGAGDLCGGCGTTASRVRQVDPDVVVTMGDLAYTNGLLSEFRQKYGGGTQPQTRWGRPEIKDITLPGYGNHDCYDVPRATGATKQGCDDAVTYFGPDSGFGTDIAGTPGSYFTTVGDWLVVHLNSAGDVGSGKATAAEVSQQNAALDNVLASDLHACEVVVWHHPRYSSGEHGNNAFVDPWFETAYANNVDVVLNGHDHDYERFAPQDGDGNAVAGGIEQFVVGSGGAAPRPFVVTQPNSLVRIVDKGILTMQLRDDARYAWEFLDDGTGAVDDSGTGTCRP